MLVLRLIVRLALENFSFSLLALTLTCDTAHRLPDLMILADALLVQVATAHNAEPPGDPTQVGVPMHHPCLLHVIDHGLARLPSLRRFYHVVVWLGRHGYHVVRSLHHVPIFHHSLLAIIHLVVLLTQSRLIRHRVILVLVERALPFLIIHGAFHEFLTIFSNQIYRIFTNMVVDV